MSDLSPAKLAKLAELAKPAKPADPADVPVRLAATIMLFGRTRKKGK